jgi:hypothetical protein
MDRHREPLRHRVNVCLTPRADRARMSRATVLRALPPDELAARFDHVDEVVDGTSAVARSTRSSAPPSGERFADLRCRRELTSVGLSHMPTGMWPMLRQA